MINSITKQIQNNTDLALQCRIHIVMQIQYDNAAQCHMIIWFFEKIVRLFKTKHHEADIVLHYKNLVLFPFYDPTTDHTYFFHCLL